MKIIPGEELSSPGTVFIESYCLVTDSQQTIDFLLRIVRSAKLHHGITINETISLVIVSIIEIPIVL